MVNYSENLYLGADYGLDPDYGKEFSADVSYKVKPGTFGYPSDPTTANQLNAVSKKLNTGAKVVEVSGVNIMGGGGAGGLLEKIPKQHFTEINRLKKLVGTDLTFHGPLVEASGYGEGGWSESNRQNAERQLWGAVERAHDLDPDGNVIVTLHSTSGLPELRTRVKGEKGEEIVEEILVNEHTGGAQRFKPKPNFLLGEEEGNLDFGKQIDSMNKEQWLGKLTQVAFDARRGQEVIGGSLRKLAKEDSGLDQEDLLYLYKEANTEKGQKYLDSLDDKSREIAQAQLHEINFGDVHLRRSYEELQNSFNEAWKAVSNSGNKQDKEKLENYRNDLQKKIETKQIAVGDPTKLVNLGEEIQKGINVLNSLSETPKIFKSMNEFVIGKSAETYANLALKSYDKFGDSAPIISIENPPVGQHALSRGDDLRDLIKEARKKFAQKAEEEFGMSKREAEKQAEKLLGITWDVGHINMMRKFGYDDKDLVGEAKKVAPYVKHIHLSDNFGFEHTELPMGMGDVPLQGHLKAIEKASKQFAKIKQIVETGDWFSRQGGFGFTTTPVKETLRAFNSPIYAMKNAPAWGAAANSYGGGFIGMGAYLPDQYFSRYGTSFSTMPVELGGQTGGRNRMSGTPME